MWPLSFSPSSGLVVLLSQALCAVSGAVLGDATRFKRGLVLKVAEGDSLAVVKGRRIAGWRAAREAEIVA